MTSHRSIGALLVALAISLAAFGATRCLAYGWAAGLGIWQGHGFVHFGHPYYGSCMMQRVIDLNGQSVARRICS